MGHDRAVPHDLHVDVVALRAVEAAVAALGAALRPAPLDPADVAALAAVPGGAALVAEHDRLLAAAARAARELADLGSALRSAGAALEEAESRAVRALVAGDR